MMLCSLLISPPVYFSSRAIPFYVYFWYSICISTFITHIKPLLRGFSSTTTAWSLFFLIIIGCSGAIFLGDGTLFSAYKKYDTWGIGGPSESLESELGTISVAQASYYIEDGHDSRRVFTSGDESSLFGASPSLINDLPVRDGIKKYKIKKGDTFSSIAAQFGITLETLYASNAGIKKIKTGQILTILPTSGALYTTQPGDTLQGIADRFGISPEIIKKYNPEYTKLLETSGVTLILPNAKETPTSIVQKEMKKENLADLAGYFVLPAKGWNWGILHDYNAVDIANTCGSNIYAAADGVVIEESSDGSWNGGYGNYVLIEHPNKTQTRYAHTLKNVVKVGDVVSQGENIAFIGSSGNTQGTTGCHLHFEVLGAKNPFALK